MSEALRKAGEIAERIRADRAKKAELKRGDIKVEYISDEVESGEERKWWYVGIQCKSEEIFDLVYEDIKEIGSFIGCPDDTDGYWDTICVEAYADYNTKAEWVKDVRKTINEI